MAMGGIGSFLGAQGSNREARKSRQFAQNEIGAARSRQGWMEFGGQAWRDFANRGNPAAAARFFGQYEPTQQAMSRLGEQLIRDNDAAGAFEQRNTDRLDRMASEQEGFARDFEAAAQARARFNTDRARRQADQVTMASMGRLGGSLLGNQLAGNAMMANNQLMDAMAQIQREGAARWQAARNSRMGLMGGRLAGMETNRRASNQLAFNARMMPVNSRSAMMGGAAFMPQQVQFGGGASPAGAAMGSLAGGLSTLGAFSLMQNGQNAGGGGGGGMGGMGQDLPYARRNV